jgi:methionine synthase I (cobalamin-dependent)
MWIGDLAPLAMAGDRSSARSTAVDAWAEQAEALANAGVHALHAETFYDVEDVHAVLEAMGRAAPALPRLLSLTVRARSTENTGSTSSAGVFESTSGVPLAALARAALDAGADVVGLNCTLTPDEMIAAVTDLRALLPPGMPLWARPCASLPPAPPASPAALARAGRLLFEAGATAVGGCCGTTPGHIAALAAAVGSADALAGSAGDAAAPSASVGSSAPPTDPDASPATPASPLRSRD